MHQLGPGHTGTCALTRHGPSGRYASLYFRLETVIGASCPAWGVDRKRAPDGRHGLDGKYIVDGRHAVAGRYGGAGRHTGGTLTGLAADVEQSSRQPEPSRVLSWGSRHLADIVAIASYLLGALFVTAHLWVNPVFRRQVGDHQDVDQAAWFMRYAATAIQHFRLPALTTTAMNAPHGVNMMWNTSMLLPGSLMTPITLLFGPQVSLTVLLVIGFAGSAASMYYVLRHWQSSTIAAALGGAVYGLSPALVNSGIGHYSLVLAMIPPLLVDRVLRLVTGDGSVTRNGLWLGVLTAAQLFISEESLVDTVIAVLILLAVLALSRPREVAARIKPTVLGLAVAAAAALLLAARGLWVQFHGIAAKAGAPPVSIHYHGQLTNLGTLPYAFVTPARTVLLHTSATVHSADGYPQPVPEYLGYLGVPLIVLLLAAIIYFWHDLRIRAAGITCLGLEWLGMGAKPLIAHAGSLPGFLLPWTYLQHLPFFSGMVADRFCIMADGAAAVVLAFALDQARNGERHFAKLRYPARLATAVAIVALLPLVPAPYRVAPAGHAPVGWRATFAGLHLSPGARVLLAPFPWAFTSQVMRWQAITAQPQTMIGGDFIAPNQSGWKGRAGRAGLSPTTVYINALYSGQAASAPSDAQITADLAAMKPQAVVADTTSTTPLGQFLIRIFGPPTTRTGQVLGWRLNGYSIYHTP